MSSLRAEIHAAFVEKMIISGKGTSLYKVILDKLSHVQLLASPILALPYKAALQAAR